MFVCGYNGDGELGEESNNSINPKGIPIICPPCKSHINLSTLLSISVYSSHMVIITQEHQAYGIGNNSDGRISPTISKTILSQETEIEFNDTNGKPFKFISAVCGQYYTLYQVESESILDKTKLIFVSSNQPPIFVNISGHTPYSLFGSYSTSAVIDTEGNINIISKKTLQKNKGEVIPLKLPSGLKAVSISCCTEYVDAIDTNGHLFESRIEKDDWSEFKELSELSNEKIVCVTGNDDNCFAVSKKGRVFCKGFNHKCRLCMPNTINKSDKFRPVMSLNMHTVVSAFAGFDHSIFKTSTGKIVGCGSNSYGNLFLNNHFDNIAYPALNIQPLCSDPFFILGNGISASMNEKEVPPKTPNRKIDPEAINKVKDTEESEMNKKLSEMISNLEKENLSLQSRISELEKEKEEFLSKEEKYKARISELEKEKEKMKSKSNETKKNLEFEFKILDEDELSKFHQIKRIGRGGMSEVFEVSRETRYARKYLIFEDEINIKDMKRLLREYEALIRLNSPHIVRAYGFSYGTETESPSIILELCPSNLKKRINELNDEERCSIIIELSEGMREVHKAGIIHGDLKLENILLDENNHVKLSDFGLCHLFNLETTQSRSQIGGTLKYMSPELILEQRDYDEKIDVYAFGVVLYVIIMKGEFPKISLGEVANGKKAKIPSNFTNFTRDLINRCWSFKSTDRPSFEEICQELKGNEYKLI